MKKNSRLNMREKPRVDLPDVKCRFLQLAPQEMRIVPALDGSTAFRFEGYAVKWASINSHREQWVKGAFADLVNAVKAGSKIVHMYYNHGWWNYRYTNPAMALRIGKWISIEEDEIGLKVIGELTPGLWLADQVRAMLEHGTIDGFSISFYEPNPMDIEEVVGENYIRIHRGDIYEISACDEPSDRDARTTDAELSRVQSMDDMKALLKGRGFGDEAIGDLINRIRTFTKPVESQKKDESPLSWVSEFA
ncbi:HK97 family phage prohead protease [Acinetobacter soli]|uniref:HK97 family phage prohead protease n=1 Tax=Acinetobacter soli TaxID=487316 RepID=UPI00148F089E|nr:HK97 family phage prohead protease [Acinetobacter soli]